MNMQLNIQQMASELPPDLQQELLDFIEFLLSKAKSRSASKQPIASLNIGRMSPDYLPFAQVEPYDAPSIYQGSPLSFEDMQAAIEEEARRHL